MNRQKQSVRVSCYSKERSVPPGHQLSLGLWKGREIWCRFDICVRYWIADNVLTFERSIIHCLCVIFFTDFKCLASANVQHNAYTGSIQTGGIEKWSSSKIMLCHYSYFYICRGATLAIAITEQQNKSLWYSTIKAKTTWLEFLLEQCLSATKVCWSHRVCVVLQTLRAPGASLFTYRRRGQRNFGTLWFIIS